MPAHSNYGVAVKRATAIARTCETAKLTERNNETMTENTDNGGATKPPGPIEVWIREKKATGFTCMVVYEDESTHEFDLVSQTLAAAQQEATGRLMPGGYQPAGRSSPSKPRGRSSQGSLGAASHAPAVVSSTLGGNRDGKAPSCPKGRSPHRQHTGSAERLGEAFPW